MCSTPQFVVKNQSFSTVMCAFKEEVVDSFICVFVTIWANRSVGMVDLMEVFVECNVSCP